MFSNQINLIRSGSSTIDNKQLEANTEAITLKQKLPVPVDRTFKQKMIDSLGDGGFLNLLWLVPCRASGNTYIE